MDPYSTRASIAGELRRASGGLGRATELLLELGDLQRGDKALYLQLEVIDLRDEVLQLAAQSARCEQRLHSPLYRQPELPF